MYPQKSERTSVIIIAPKIFKCYSDGICFNAGEGLNNATLYMNNCVIAENGRNGVTDNAVNSLIENCSITNNGTRTLPKVGYHIEPDFTHNFGLKRIVNCIIIDNIENNIGIKIKKS